MSELFRLLEDMKSLVVAADFNCTAPTACITLAAAAMKYHTQGISKRLISMGIILTRRLPPQSS